MTFNSCERCGASNTSSDATCHKCGNNLGIPSTTRAPAPSAPQASASFNANPLIHQTGKPLSSAQGPFIDHSKKPQPQMPKSFDSNLWWQALLLGGGLLATGLIYILLHDWPRAVIWDGVGICVFLYGVYAKLTYQD